MYLCISEKEREQAIQKLIEAVPREVFLQIYEEIFKKPDWLVTHHFGVGIEIRNLLRVKGFAWDDVALDCEWGPITLEAARRVYESAQ